MLKWLELFLASVYTQIKIPHMILVFFLIIFLLIIFFCVLNETKEGEFDLGPNRYFLPSP